MAEGATRLIVFFGTEQQRRYWVHQKRLDDRRVLLAHSAARGALHGLQETVEPWICSGDDGLEPEDRRHLMHTILALNTLYGKKNR